MHLICQLLQQNAKQYLRVHWQKNSTASLKNSTDAKVPTGGHFWGEPKGVSNERLPIWWDGSTIWAIHQIIEHHETAFIWGVTHVLWTVIANFSSSHPITNLCLPQIFSRKRPANAVPHRDYSSHTGITKLTVSSLLLSKKCPCGIQAWQVASANASNSRSALQPIMHTAQHSTATCDVFSYELEQKFGSQWGG